MIDKNINTYPNGLFNFYADIDIDRAFKKISHRKATRVDYISDILFNNKEAEESLKLRIRMHFKQYLRERKTSIYFMQVKMIFLNKYKTDNPIIEDARPISILPAIAKLLMISILQNLEKAIEIPIFNKNQMDFWRKKNSPRLTNIEHLIMNRNKIRTDHHKKETAVSVFFNFHKAYDFVPRDILINKLAQYNIPWNIIRLIKNMISVFTIHYEGKIITTKRGLIQGSVLFTSTQSIH